MHVDIANLRALELQERVAVMVIHMASSQPAPRSPTLSIGIATSPEHGHTGEDLLRGADAALLRQVAVATALFVQRSSRFDCG